MGNCCTADNRAEDLPNMKDSTLAMPATEGGHAPAPAFAEKIAEMNALN